MAQILENELHKYWELLNTPQKESIIGLIKSFLQPAQNEERISIDQYNKEVDEAMARMDAGNFLTHDEVLKRAKNW